jgi:hypothetical protein
MAIELGNTCRKMTAIDDSLEEANLGGAASGSAQGRVTRAIEITFVSQLCARRVISWMGLEHLFFVALNIWQRKVIEFRPGGQFTCPNWQLVPTPHGLYNRIGTSTGTPFLSQDFEAALQPLCVY